MATPCRDRASDWWPGHCAVIDTRRVGRCVAAWRKSLWLVDPDCRGCDPGCAACVGIVDRPTSAGTPTRRDDRSHTRCSIDRRLANQGDPSWWFLVAVGRWEHRTPYRRTIARRQYRPATERLALGARLTG